MQNMGPRASLRRFRLLDALRARASRPFFLRGRRISIGLLLPCLESSIFIALRDHVTVFLHRPSVLLPEVVDERVAHAQHV